MKKILTLVLALCTTLVAMADTTLSVDCGKQVQITATAVTGYHFVKWSDGSTTNPRTVTVSSDSTLRAYFSINQYQVQFQNWDGTVLQDSLYDYGTTPVYTGTPTRIDPTGAVTYTFSGWSPAITTVTADVVYVAQFTSTANLATITAVSQDATKGSVTGGGQYQIGKTATLTATPADACYVFEKWSDGDTTNPRTVTVSADATYTAVFRQLQYNFTVETDNATQGTVDATLVL